MSYLYYLYSVHMVFMTIRNYKIRPHIKPILPLVKKH